MSLILKLDGIQNRSQVDIDAAKKQSKELMQAMAFTVSAKGMQAEWEDALSIKSQVARACKAMSPSTIGEALAAQKQDLLKQFHSIPTISDYLAEYQLLTPFVSAATVMESYAPRAETKAERKERELNEQGDSSRKWFQQQIDNERLRNEQEIENHVEAMRRFEVEKQAAQPQAETVVDAGAVGKWSNENNSAGSFIITSPEHRKTREDIDELRHLREKKGHERDEKRQEDEHREFHKQTQFIIDQSKRHKEILIDECVVDAVSIIKAEEQANNAHSQGDGQSDAGAGSDTTREPKEQELTSWLRETWIKEERPGGTDFFNKLKKYVMQKGSPITEHYSAGKAAGIGWKTSAGTTGEMKKKTIQTKVSTFKSTP